MKLMMLLLSFAITCAGDTVLREIERSGVKQKSIGLDAGSFTFAYIERLARGELTLKPNSRFIQLLIYGTKGGAPLPKPAHLPYEHWHSLRASIARTPNEIAEMISIGRDAVLRVRDANGSIRKRVLTGKDPLQLDLQGTKVEIVYIALSVPSAHTVQRVDVYLRTDDEMTVKAGLDLLRTLEPIFSGLEVSLAIRNDTWFIYEPSYPFSNPFVEEFEPPTPEEYSGTQTLKCGRWSRTASCRLE